MGCERPAESHDGGAGDLILTLGVPASPWSVLRGKTLRCQRTSVCPHRPAQDQQENASWPRGGSRRQGVGRNRCRGNCGGISAGGGQERPPVWACPPPPGAAPQPIPARGGSPWSRGCREAEEIPRSDLLINLISEAGGSGGDRASEAKAVIGKEAAVTRIGQQGRPPRATSAVLDAARIVVSVQI